MSGAVVPGLSLLSLHLIATFEFKQKRQEEQAVETPQVETQPEKIVENKQPVETKKEVPVLEFPIAVEEEKIVEPPVEVEIESPIEVELEKPKEEEIIQPVETNNEAKEVELKVVQPVVKKESPKRNRSKIATIGDPNIRKVETPGFVKSTKPAVVEQPIAQEETDSEVETNKKVKLPRFKK